MKSMTAFVIALGLMSLSAAAYQVVLAKPIAQSTQPYAPTIDPANFVTKIDNPYFPLTPGTTMIFEGKTETGFEHTEARVSSDTKVIMGVKCVSVVDTVTVDGKLEELTTDWYSQDKQGNVWYFGEDSKAYKDGKVVSTKGSWLGGVKGAYPGYIMKAKPVVGETYRQEYFKGEAEDMATLVSLNETTSVPQGSYKNVWMTKEWSALENPPVIEHKYYAKGIGQIMTTGGTGKESWKLSLIEIRSK
jgi:hypothetical protein